MSRPLKIGDVVEITYTRRVPKGHEQEGKRPAIVIGLPDSFAKPRHPILITIPVTTNVGDWSNEKKLYVKLQKGEGNLLENSIVLTDQIVSTDITRVSGFFGTISDKRISLIKDILKQIFELSFENNVF